MLNAPPLLVLPKGGKTQGRNQDLNLAKQKYEILTGRKNCC
jgi:hypothetical protein